MGLLGGVNLSTATAGDANGKRPNILLMVTDDLGYSDVSCFRDKGKWKPRIAPPGNVKGIDTPHLDALAKQGMMLTDFHSNCSVCSPTRASILTGRYNHRTGVSNVLGQLGKAMRQVQKPGEEPFLGLSLDELTIAEVLKAGGYRTGMFGKWHLGPMSTHHPMDQGFEVFVGTGGNAGDNFAMKQGPGHTGKSYFFRGRETVDAPGHWHTDVLADETIKFMTQPNMKPFFAYVPFTAPHVPYVGPNDEKLANSFEGNEAYGMGPRKDFHKAHKEIVEGLDAAIGRIMDALKKQGLLENTLVLFTSDNGPIQYGSAYPYRGGKAGIYEGGTRVPTIACWPGMIPAGSRSKQLGMTMDLLPTLAAIGRCKLPAGRKLDGINLADVLTQQKTKERGMVFWEKPVQVWMKKFHLRQWAVRDGKWSAVQERNNAPMRLYNLETDPGQKRDLAKKHPNQLARMKAAFGVWKKDVYNDSPWKLDEYMERFEKAGILEK
jgi:arylsulfatase A-like enzyme